MSGKEVSRITAKMEELKGSSVQCIAEHPGFATPCLDFGSYRPLTTSIVSVMESVEYIRHGHFRSKAINYHKL